MALKRVAIPSPNYSSRGGTKVRLIVLHTAEGATTYQSLGSFFKNPASQVSSHTGIDDTLGTIGEYVQRSGKAWTAANANPYSIQTELCAFANWSPSTWDQHPNMLQNCADWIAEEAKYFGIPIVRLTASQAQSGATGVCQHVDLGAMGGGHWDCGTNFPMDRVLSLAKGSTPPSPTPTPPTGKAPPFPYPNNNYLGKPSSDPKCHSGFYGGVDQQNVRTWQQQMVNRKWKLSVDGMFGDESTRICKQFQTNKGLSVDGLVGPQTWNATWTAPVG